MNSPTPESIAEYYNKNTARFLRFGGSRDTAAIHRRIWAPGVKKEEQAFMYLNRLVGEAIRPALSGAGSEAHVLDLGCGVGGTSTWMSSELGVRVTGLTNSPVQVEIARRRADCLGLGNRCRFFRADFHELPRLAPVQAAWAIESLSHAVDPARFFQQVAAQLDQRGRLVICDDFLTAPEHEFEDDHRARGWIRRLRAGWQLPELLSAEHAVGLAEQHGFRVLASQDLTQWLRNHPQPILSLLALITRLPLPSLYWHNLAGGTALQVCLQTGWIRYQQILFIKV